MTNKVSIRYERLYKKVTLDPKSFPECHTKEISKFKLSKFGWVTWLVHHKKEGKWDIKKIE